MTILAGWVPRLVDRGMYVVVPSYTKLRPVPALSALMAFCASASAPAPPPVGLTFTVMAPSQGFQRVTVPLAFLLMV